MSSPTLSPTALNKARRAILKSYPFLKRVKAEVQPAPNDCFVVRFKASTPLKDGTLLRQQVRATVTASGDVLKVVSSR